MRTTSDGRAVIFRDARLECRTNGTGAVAERDLNYLKTLDIGYGYSADGGRTFPTQGPAIGAIPTVEDMLAFYNHAADLRPARRADGRSGGRRLPARPCADRLHPRLRRPEARARLRPADLAGFILDNAASAACTEPYRKTGWLEFVPEACNGQTLILDRNGSFTLWGWPYRFRLARMSGAGARFFIAGDDSHDDHWVGSPSRNSSARCCTIIPGCCW